MVKKITTILLLTVILTSLFIVVNSGIALAKGKQPNYTVCWTQCRYVAWPWNEYHIFEKCCGGFSPYYKCTPWEDTFIDC